MDDRRFDSLVRSLASGASRRSVLKGLLGLGGAALTGAVLVEGDADAARRTTPTPTPVRCPGKQTWNGTACVCPGGLVKCGPDCCHSTVPPTDPTYSICCDQACCPYPNDCVGEEMCCPRLPDVACLTPSGACCTTLCEETPGGAVCCPTNQFCPGGSTSDDLCCNGDTPIKCDCGTNANACIADTDAACCHDSDCDTPPPGSTACAVGTCRNHVCQYTDCNASTEVCCPDNTGKHACRVGDECCLSNQDCADTCEACVGYVCVDDPITFPCGPQNDPDRYCCPDSNYSLCCGASQYECCGFDQAAGVTRECDADGKCCELGTPYFCADSNSCCANPCTISDGKELCCATDQIGCNGACCSGVCLTDQTPNVCCAADDVCRGGSESDDICCSGNATCCGGGTNANACVDLTVEGSCCTDGDCGDPCEICFARTHTCGPRCDTGEVCCTDVAGATCQTGTCCPGEPCPTQGQLCCVSGGVATCVTTTECCTIDSDCDGSCQVCSNGACVSECTGQDVCCTEGGTEACCPESECLSGIGCCETANICGTECCGAGEYCCTQDGESHCIADDLCCADSDCDSMLCQECQGGSCVDICTAQGLICNGQGSCVPACIETGNACTSTDTCCDDGVCCNGTCQTTYTYCGDVCYPGQLCCPEDAVCFHNADCCGTDTKSPCCRHVGGTNACKPGEGACYCEVDSDCDVVKNKPRCVNGTCSN